jgi:hypothetical protein
MVAPAVAVKGLRGMACEARSGRHEQHRCARSRRNGP